MLDLEAWDGPRPTGGSVPAKKKLRRTRSPLWSPWLLPRIQSTGAQGRPGLPAGLEQHHSQVLAALCPCSQAHRTLNRTTSRRSMQPGSQPLAQPRSSVECTCPHRLEENPAGSCPPHLPSLQPRDNQEPQPAASDGSPHTGFSSIWPTVGGEESRFSPAARPGQVVSIIAAAGVAGTTQGQQLSQWLHLRRLAPQPATLRRARAGKGWQGDAGQLPMGMLYPTALGICHRKVSPPSSGQGKRRGLQGAF